MAASYLHVYERARARAARPRVTLANPALGPTLSA
jgi:hypothetical protein